MAAAGAIFLRRILQKPHPVPGSAPEKPLLARVCDAMDDDFNFPKALSIVFEGIRFASVMNEFAPQIKKIGSLGKGEGIAPEDLKLNLEAATRIIPFVKLVERERLRAPASLRVSPDPEAAHVAFYESEAFDRLFHEVVLDKLETARILLLLEKNAMTTGEISRRLGLDPSTVARHMNDASRHGWIRYDPAQKSFCAA